MSPMAPPALSYTNRRGQVYYLHAGTTTTGKVRYFVAKAVGPGALSELPEGLEIVESINGVVSVRRIDPNAPRVPDGDLARVRSELANHAHLRSHRAEVVKGEIIVFEPIVGTRYAPVMRLMPSGAGYAVFRMTYRGDGGWSWPLAHGPLEELATRYLKQIGTDEFFELD